MSIYLRVAFWMLAAAVLAGQGAAYAQSAAITKADVSGVWPLTVERAHIECVDSVTPLLRVGNKHYAINGPGRRVTRPLDSANPLWAKDEYGLNVGLYSLTQKALELCGYFQPD